jgi:hypothetical protein
MAEDTGFFTDRKESQYMATPRFAMGKKPTVNSLWRRFSAYSTGYAIDQRFHRWSRFGIWIQRWFERTLRRKKRKLGAEAGGIQHEDSCEWRWMEKSARIENNWRIGGRIDGELARGRYKSHRG